MDGEAPAESVTLRDQFGVIARRWRIVALASVLGLVLAGAYAATRPTMYTSHAQIVVQPPNTGPGTGNTTPTQNLVVMPTEKNNASSVTVAAIAEQTLVAEGHTRSRPGALLKHVSVTVPTTSQILDIAFSAPTARLAHDGADAFAKAYLENRKAIYQPKLEVSKKSVQDDITSLQNQQTKLAQQAAQASSPTEKQILLAQVQSASNQIQQYSSELAQLATLDPTSASISQQATLPNYPSGTRKSILLALGLAAGLILGLAGAFVRDATDDHLRGPNDLAQLIKAPVLARVPLLRRLPGGRPVDLTAEGTRHPTVAESYRSLASRLLVLGATDTMRSVMIASPAPGEGRSSVSANLAASLVDLGYRVWLVSADLRPPQVHRLFGMHDEPDLVDVVPMDSERVQGRNSSSLVVRAHADREGGYGHLTLVSEPDRRPIGAGRLISPLALVRLVEENQHVADLTIIDAPPLLEYADAVPLLPRVDAVIVVADAGLTRRSDLEELTDLLGGTRARVVGAVLNRDGSRTTTRRSRRARARLDQRNRPMRRTRGTEASSRAPSPSAEPPVAEPPVAEPVADRSDDHLAEGSSERVDAAPPNGDRGADPGNQAGAGEERLRGVFVPSVRVTAVGWPEPPITHSRGAEETPTNVGWS